MAVESELTASISCCMNISASIEAFLQVAELMGWTQSSAVPVA
jgi:hypothetical protein